MSPHPEHSIYLDNAATTPVAPEVREAMWPWLGEAFGNPSSRHPLGVRAATAVDEARWKLGRALGAEPEGVIFTAGGTEADNLGVIGLARAARRASNKSAARGHVLVGATEHPAVARSAAALAREGFEVERLRLRGTGELDLDDAAAKLRPDTVLVAQMLVNNEFGSIYPVQRLAALMRARAPQARLHVDAVQGFGKLPVSLGELGADSIALSAHKLHGPKGIGALIVARGVEPEPLVHGGGQERGLRSGTENVAGIVGFARAAELALQCADETLRRAAESRAVLRDALSKLPDARLLEPDGGDGVLPTIASLQLGGPPAEVYLHHLEARGIYVSAGSACQAQSHELSAALLALGLDEQAARHVLRFSFAHSTTPAEVRTAVEVLADLARSFAAAGKST